MDHCIFELCRFHPFMFGDCKDERQCIVIACYGDPQCSGVAERGVPHVEDYKLIGIILTYVGLLYAPESV